VSPREPLMVDVAIPVYNEEFRIAYILQDVVSSVQSDWFQLNNIFVISDSSTDRSEDIVQQFCKSDERVKLITKSDRRGKNDSINLAFNHTHADALIFLDSDIRLDNDKVLQRLVEPIYKGQAALVGANVVPDGSSATLNLAIMARQFDYILESERRRRKPISYWSFYGRTLAMSRELFQNLTLPASHADDLYIYYSCLRNGYKVFYANDALVYFKAPSSVKDFVDQYSRFEFWKDKAREEFGEDFVNSDLKVTKMASFLLSTFARNPYRGLLWTGCLSTSKIAYLIKYRTDFLERGFYKTWVLDSDNKAPELSTLSKTGKVEGE